MTKKRSAQKQATAGRKSGASGKAGRPKVVPATKPFWVCGIGASAGGLEAFTQLLRALPADTGLAFVLVQHLDPKHESLLSELLARTTTMPVLEVEDGMPVQPNHIYVIPRNRDMAIRDDVLRLLPRLETRGQHMPVDSFFRSMAENLGERAIGVILSGSASDGAAGLKAIKAEGGITFAQDEKSAKYDSMPRSAVAAGAVDFVLPPEEIAVELARIGRHAVPAHHPKGSAAEEIVVEGGDAFHRILALLYKATSLDFNYYKQPTIKRRIARRMMMLAVQNIDNYVAHLQKNPAEVEALSQDILIHVTGFFRDPRTFQALKSKILPRIVRSSPKDAPIRIWIPGCSTGEEAYSLAICLFEYLGDHPIARQVQIFATDVSELAIDKARVGVYSATIASEVSPERLRRFFVKLEGGYQISKTIRDICIFAKQDITKDPPFSNMDLISCRNVLIYLGTVLQRRVLSLFHYALRPTGILVLGTAESISGFTDLFNPMDTKHRFYMKKPHRGHHADLPGGVYEMGKGTAVSKPVLPPPPDLYKEVDRTLLRRYVPPAVLINEKLDILQFRGRTSPYLEPSPGEASLNLTRMAREGLMLELSTAVHRARNTSSAVRQEGVRFQHNGGAREVNLEVIPLGSGKERSYLVMFEEPAPAPASGSARKRAVEKSASEKTSSPARVERLQQELAATKDYLRSIIESQEVSNEELRSAYEEIQSSNEELQSTNEELETAKEELQSTNEELTTLNDTLQSKNYELGQLNNDLNNLFASMNVPIVMLGPDLRIRNYTPLAEKVLNLIPADVGRPIGNIKPNIDIEHLEEPVAEVLESLQTKELEVRDRGGRWYSLRIRPYRTFENKIEGAVLSLFDIHALKTSLEDIRASRQNAEAIVETVQQPLLVLDADLRVKKANPSFYRAFQLSPEETEEHFIYELGGGRWNSPGLRLLLEEIVPKDTRFEDFEIECEFENIGRRTLLLNGRRLEGAGQTTHILLAISDVTERRSAAELRYRRLFETAKDAIVIADAETGQITDANPAIVDLLGYTRSELLLLGRKFSEFISVEDLDKWQSAAQELNEKGYVRLESVGVETKTGSKLDVECVCNTYLEGARRVVQSNLRDVTKRRRSEGQIHKALREKEVLLKEVHHRVKNNLQIIYSLLNLQARHIRDKATLELYKESQNRVKSMALIHEELYRSKDLANIDFGQYLRKLVSSLMHVFGRSPEQVKIDVDAASVLLGIDTAIPCGLLVSELVSNALKHAFPGERKGEVRVRLQPEGDHNYSLTVADNGVGLPGSLDVGNSQSLGLQLVKTLTEQLGGEMEVGNAGGTEFKIRFRELEYPERG